MRYLTFALGKGRLANQTLELFEKIGITCEEMKDKNSRKLIFTNEELKLRFFLAKGPDVPTYVEYGAADIGVGRCGGRCCPEARAEIGFCWNGWFSIFLHPHFMIFFSCARSFEKNESDYLYYNRDTDKLQAISYRFMAG